MHKVSQQVYELLLRYGEIQEADKAEIADKMLGFIQRFDADPLAIELAEYVGPEVYAIGVLAQLGAPLTEAGEHQKTKHLEAARQRGKPLELPDHLAARLAKTRMN